MPAAERAYLVGTWQHEAAPITYEFRADGTLSLTTESRAPIEGTYTADEATGQLTIEYDGFETIASYVLEEEGQYADLYRRKRRRCHP